MKALEILETLRDEYIHGELTSDIKEAIKELEDLQNRSCENCKHQNEGSSRFFCSKINISFDIGGCGDYWEIKR